MGPSIQCHQNWVSVFKNLVSLGVLGEFSGANRNKFESMNTCTNNVMCIVGDCDIKTYARALLLH